MMKFYSSLKNVATVKQLVLFVLLITGVKSFGQNVGINSTSEPPDASAGLDVNFTDKGLLIPRVSLTGTTDVTTISSPATSLLVYNTAEVSDVVAGYYYFDGTKWVRLSTSTSSSSGTSPWIVTGSSVYYNGGNVGIGVTSPTYKLQIGASSDPLFLSGVQEGNASDSLLTITNGLVRKIAQNGSFTTGWSLSGNTAASSNFIGSVNDVSLRFRTNNTQRFIIDSLGNVGVGVLNPTYKLQVEAASNPLYLGGVQYGSASDSVLTINNGVVKKLPQASLSTSGWSTAGNTINSSNFVGSVNNASLRFKTNNAQHVIIDSLGNVGIGSKNPTYKLQVESASNPLYLSGLQDGSGTDSVLTVKNGVVKKITQASAGFNSWSTSGNNNATSSSFLGTSNNLGMRFRTGNVQRMILDSLGSVGFGTSPQFTTGTSRERMLLELGSSIYPLSAFSIRGTTDNFIQLNLQNMSDGQAASSDIVATSDYYNKTSKSYDNYIDMGINSSGNNSKTWGGPKDGYLYVNGGNLSLGSSLNNGNIYFLTGGQLAVSNARMVIDYFGNIGMGAASPGFKLYVSGTSGFTGAARFSNSLTTLGNVFLHSLGTSSTSDSLLTTSNGSVKRVVNTSWQQSGNAVTAEQKIGTTSSFGLPFVTNNVERMRITSGGTVAIGTNTNPDETNYKLYVNGGVYATSYNNTSDARFKTNIKDLNYGLSSVLSLRPVSYNWKDTTQDQTTQIGLIAQEAKKVIPEVVKGDEDKGKLSINYIELIPVLINAVKEQQAKIDAQQKEIDELKKLVNK